MRGRIFGLVLVLVLHCGLVQRSTSATTEELCNRQTELNILNRLLIPWFRSQGRLPRRHSLLQLDPTDERQNKYLFKVSI